MPELPEVETVRLQLQRKIKGETITDVTIYHPRVTLGQKNFKHKLVNQTIEHVDRIGKLLIFSFTNQPDLYLLAHLKMTGQFFFVGKSGQMVGGGHSENKTEPNTFPHKHSRVAFSFASTGTLYFNDMRLFGYLKIASAKELAEVKSKYGPEPIEPDFDINWFTKALIQKKTVIKAALLNQNFVAGLGNIYVDEALWRARVSPLRRCNTLSNREAKAIASAAGAVMNESIKVGGTTFQHFIDTDGNKGNFSNFLQVFGKQGTPCPRCQTTIKKIKLAGRGTHFCPNCQR